ncbi:MAG: hypothetical protein ACKN9R_03865 [Candidatus Limnocylindrus sp.]
MSGSDPEHLEQLTLDELAAGHEERRSVQPLRPMPSTHVPIPPRIPFEDQRLIRRLWIIAPLCAAAAVVGMLSVNPLEQPLLGACIALLLGGTVSAVTTPLLLVEAHRRTPGHAELRRRRAVRRGLLLGLLLGGYSLARTFGLGGPTGLAVAALIAFTVEAAFTRADIHSV